LSVGAIETGVELRRARLEMMLKVLDVDGAVRRVRGGWESTGRPWAYDGQRYERVEATRGHEQQRMLAYSSTGECRLAFLRRELDDDTAADCGRCDNCAGPRFGGDVSRDATAAAAATLNRPGIVVEPRRMWPAGMKSIDVPVSGKIPEAERAETGRALGRMSDIGWGNALRALFADPADGQADDAMCDALIKVLAAWDWEHRPDTVVSVGSRSRPLLVDGLAQRMAAIGRMDYLGALTRRGGAPSRPDPSNSARRLAGVHDAFTVGFEVPPGSDVLLIDDVRESGWTLTVAARLLRRAGARSVLPLVLAVDG
jgi:ATP-dependent DNA helicase RecQ